MSSAKKNSRFLPTSENFRYEEFPFYWLARVNAIYTQQMEPVLKKLGTDVPTRRVLHILFFLDATAATEISTHAIIKLSTITRIVQRMRDEGLVHTATNPEDARITDVSMTPKGESLLAEIQQATSKIFVRGYGDLSEARLMRISKDLEQIFNNLADH